MARVAFIGDSHGQVLGRLVSGLIPGGLAVNVARPGWSEAKYLSSGELAKARGADLVIVQLGGNNYDLSASSYTKTLERVVAAVGGASRVLWVGPSTATDAAVSARHEATAALQARLLPSMGVTWLDSRPVTRTGHRSDGVHFVDYKPWARAIVGALADAAPVAGAPKGWWLAGGLLLAGLAAVAWRRR